MIICLMTNENTNEIGWQSNENANEMCPGKLMKMIPSFYDNRPNG